MIKKVIKLIKFQNFKKNIHNNKIHHNIEKNDLKKSYQLMKKKMSSLIKIIMK